VSRSEAVIIRLTKEERQLLNALVENERERLSDEGIAAITSMTQTLVTLVVRECRERGLGTGEKKGRRK